MKRFIDAVRRAFRSNQQPYKPDSAAAAEAAARAGEVGEVVIRWSQRTAYLFIETDDKGGLVYTNLPNTLCPRCKHLITDDKIVDPAEFATHRCGNKSGRL